MRARHHLAVIGVALCVGGVIGHVSTANPPPQVRTVTVHSPPQVITKVETKEVEVKVPLPDSCVSLTEASRKSFDEDEKISLAGGKINKAVFDGVAFLAAGNTAQWNKTEQAIYDAQRELNAALLAKGTMQESINRLEAECNKAMENQ